jgi:hypothetical protein
MSPQSDLSIHDLYNALDWSKAEDALTKWSKHLERPDAPKLDPDCAPFTDRFRKTLLAYALPIEISGPLPAESPDIRNAARRLLTSAGVWNQAVDWLVQQDLLGPAEEETAEQLAFEFSPN